MKNIFKFFGIAALACTLMVACGKDNNEPEDTTPAETPIPDGVSFTFDGTTNTEWGYQAANYYEEYSQFYLMYLPSEESFANGIKCWINTTAGVQNLSADVNNYYSLADEQAIEYWKERILQNRAGTAFWGDYWTKEATVNVKAVDMTALTMTCKAEGTMFDAAAVLIDATPYASATTAPFVLTIGNVEFPAPVEK